MVRWVPVDLSGRNTGRPGAGADQNPQNKLARRDSQAAGGCLCSLHIPWETDVIIYINYLPATSPEWAK